jgi:hypothetical protein
MRSSGKLRVIAKRSRERLLFGQVRRAAALPLGQCFKLRRSLLAVVFDIARTRFGQIEECRELARHAVEEKDRAFWQQAAARWEEQLRGAPTWRDTEGAPLREDATVLVALSRS